MVTMKVLDLQCQYGHSFEGWFGSQADYDGQRARGLVTCPVCNDSEITRMLSAPRLNLGHGVDPALSQPSVHPASTGPVQAAVASNANATETPDVMPPQASRLPDVSSDTLQQIQSAVLNMVRHVMANTEDVGPRFAEEARKIHYGEGQERSIRGQATREETEALLDEGIEVMPLPLPENLKGTLQ